MGVLKWNRPLTYAPAVHLKEGLEVAPLFSDSRLYLQGKVDNKPLKENKVVGTRSPLVSTSLLALSVGDLGE